MISDSSPRVSNCDRRIFTKECECGRLCQTQVGPLTTLAVDVSAAPEVDTVRFRIGSSQAGLLLVALQPDSVKKLLFALIRYLDSCSHTKTSRGAASAICQLIRSSL